ncbi:MAG: zf-HC2 domain-containing protein [Candidatus Aminicenantes bacterium]|jgi:predicted anti-sigma-YlaC factor YlaD
MDHERIKELISSYHDGGLSGEQKKAVEKHVQECVECHKELEEMKKFEEVMSQMELKKPKPEVWQVYWTSVYNRLERRIGWILFSVGAMILLFFGGYKMFESLIRDTDTPFLVKVGILTGLAGLVVLLVSVLRERIFTRKRERYKEVEK